MASSNLLTPESEIHLPRVRTADRDRSEQKAHAWLQRYGVRDSPHTAVKNFSYDDDKSTARGLADAPFFAKQPRTLKAITSRTLMQPLARIEVNFRTTISAVALFQ
jgi:hemin uptake protein HemP